VSDAIDFNPFDPAVRRDPHAIYARARAEAPILTHEGIHAHSVFRYADILEILRDANTWSSEFRGGIPDRDDVQNSMIGLDAPRHTRLRSLVNRAFTPGIIRRREQRLREIARDLVADAAATDGPVDIVDALTHPLPMIVIAEILGVPVEDRGDFKRWSEVLIATLGSGLLGPGPSPEEMEREAATSAEMGEYVKALAAKRRAKPEDDLITGLIEAEEEGSKLNFDELLSMVTLLLIAGNETTTTLIGNSILTLLEHPDQLAKLRANPELMPTAIDEVMRFTSPVQLNPRRCTRSVELHGSKIEGDDMVLCWLGSAGRDETVFDEPDRFDITRSPNRHLGFGFGPHFCLGQTLALLETRIALEALLAGTASFARSDSNELPLHPSFVFNGYTRIPLHLEPA
jgi:cytochrome P450